MNKIYTIKDDYTETRLDRWFRKNITHVPQSLIEKNIRRGKIKVNHKRLKVHISYKRMIKLIFITLHFLKKKKYNQNIIQGN